MARARVCETTARSPAPRTMVCLNWEMQQTRAFSAIHRALTHLLPELPETAEGLSKLEHIVWDIMKSFEEEGLRASSVRKRLTMPVSPKG